MNTRTARKIERYARVNGISFLLACAILGARGGRKSPKRKTDAQINEERFEKMKAGRPDLYA